MSDPLDVDAIQERLRRFAADRDWDRFHNPKNLAMATAVEAAELMELFQWLTPDESAQPPPELSASIRDEIADVLIYVIRLADTVGVDVVRALEAKLETNERRFPPHIAGQEEDREPPVR